ncbi:hypothetical protein RRG08_009191 [Elysia crispata]|uniref:Uncharacterized protein n=1 Tax=Elysia crispata TaxID=231223 RepID=A0AAE0Z7X6_9GAST|nr:hypothetical protein RRG08_009191 [Elysia crispata]
MWKRLSLLQHQAEVREGKFTFKARPMRQHAYPVAKLEKQLRGAAGLSAGASFSFYFLVVVGECTVYVLLFYCAT